MALMSILALCYFAAPALAQSNGMDMSMDGPMNLAVGNMLPYAHVTPGDNVWFPGWVPRSAGTMVGTCIGVFLLAMLERWLAACLGLAEWHWAERECTSASETSEVASFPSSPASTEKSGWLQSPLFVSETDVARGVLFGAHAFIRVLLMMVVMTFQLAFIFSIAVGSGVGETLFGRFASVQEH